MPKDLSLIIKQARQMAHDLVCEIKSSTSIDAPHIDSETVEIIEKNAEELFNFLNTGELAEEILRINKSQV